MAPAPDDGPESGDGATGSDAPDPHAGEAADGDTFGVGIHVTADTFELVVKVPSAIDSGWTDPEAFQRRVEAVTWDRLDRAATLQAVDTVAATGETVLLGTVTLRPDGTVLDHTLSPPEPSSE